MTDLVTLVSGNQKYIESKNKKNFSFQILNEQNTIIIIVFVIKFIFPHRVTVEL